MAEMVAILDIRMILAIFDLQVTLMLPTKFQVILVQEKKRKIDFL